MNGMDSTRDNLSGRNEMKTEVRVEKIQDVIIPYSLQADESGLIPVEAVEYFRSWILFFFYRSKTEFLYHCVTKETLVTSSRWSYLDSKLTETVSTNISFNRDD